MSSRTSKLVVFEPLIPYLFYSVSIVKDALPTRFNNCPMWPVRKKSFM